MSSQSSQESSFWVVHPLDHQSQRTGYATTSLGLQNLFWFHQELLTDLQVHCCQDLEYVLYFGTFFLNIDMKDIILKQLGLVPNLYSNFPICPKTSKRTKILEGYFSSPLRELLSGLTFKETLSFIYKYKKI